MPASRPSKRRKVSPAASFSDPSQSSASEDEESGSDVEREYERLPRKLKKKESSRLPIKTAEGWVEQDTKGVVNQEESDSFLGSDESSEQEDFDSEAEEIDDAAPRLSPREQILKAKEELARIAALINEDPEEHVGGLKALAQISKSTNITVKQLAIATQCAVYKDIIPGYRVRSLTDEELKEKVSREVKRFRNYEQSIVSGYQAYVKALGKLSRTRRGNRRPDIDSLASTAIQCASTLLLGAPHFNFRGDLLKIVVGPLGRRNTGKNYDKCINTLESMFKDDEDGRPSLEAVSTLTKMMKARNYRVHESLLNLFLRLRLLSEFSVKGSYDRIDRKDGEFPKKGKKPKEKREFRTKRDRKLIKERKVVEKEMMEADAVVGYEERDRMQAEMLKLVFATYFRILKAKTPHLMGAVLEGLARYAHLINQDFFADILEALRELIETSAASVEDDADGETEENEDEIVRNATRESLLCVVTAFALLQGQYGTAAASTLHLDLNFFITHLYRTLYSVSLDADIELSSKSLHLPDPNASYASQPSNRVNAKTTTVLLIRSLSSILLPRSGLRSVPPLRLAAFAKQLMTASLQLPEKSCMAMLGLLAQTTKVHGRKVAALWNSEERKGDGVFNALSDEVERSNPNASTVWEGELLRLHFSPKVRDALKIIQANIRAV
jgi:nucleolar complex protein 3